MGKQKYWFCTQNCKSVDDCSDNCPQFWNSNVEAPGGKFIWRKKRELEKLTHSSADTGPINRTMNRPVKVTSSYLPVEILLNLAGSTITAHRTQTRSFLLHWVGNRDNAGILASVCPPNALNQEWPVLTLKPQTRPASPQSAVDWKRYVLFFHDYMNRSNVPLTYLFLLQWDRGGCCCFGSVMSLEADTFIVLSR